VDDDVMRTFKEVSDLAPLHKPANIMGIDGGKKVLPNVPHCAVMDNRLAPDHAGSSFLYALPRVVREERGAPLRFPRHLLPLHVHNARRLSWARIRTRPTSSSRTSATVRPSTPSRTAALSTLPWAFPALKARDGDPLRRRGPGSALLHDARRGTLRCEAEAALNKKSGLLGITGKYTDRRDIQAAVEKGDERAVLAQDIEAYRIKKYIGAYTAALGRVDALVFTAGVGEMAPFIREKVLTGL
jgi:acetate kinase